MRLRAPDTMEKQPKDLAVFRCEALIGRPWPKQLVRKRPRSERRERSLERQRGDAVHEVVADAAGHVANARQVRDQQPESIAPKHLVRLDSCPHAAAGGGHAKFTEQTWTPENRERVKQSAAGGRCRFFCSFPGGLCEGRMSREPCHCTRCPCCTARASEARRKTARRQEGAEARRVAEDYEAKRPLELVARRLASRLRGYSSVTRPSVGDMVMLTETGVPAGGQEWEGVAGDIGWAASVSGGACAVTAVRTPSLSSHPPYTRDAPTSGRWVSLDSLCRGQNNATLRRLALEAVCAQDALRTHEWTRKTARYPYWRTVFGSAHAQERAEFDRIRLHCAPPAANGEPAAVAGALEQATATARP